MVPNPVSYYRSASYSHVGMVRKVNKDTGLDVPESGPWVVADGMGGHTTGDFVGNLIVDTLRRIPAASPLPAYIGALCTGLVQVNEWTRQKVGLRGVSVADNTLVLLAVHGNQANCPWTGDGRLYRPRSGVPETISRDYSYVQESLNNALTSEEETRHHPRADVVTRAVSVHEQLELSEAAPHVLPGDGFLLYSDGLNKAADDSELRDVLSYSGPYAVVRSLVHSGLTRGAPDNITALVVRAL